MTVRTRVLAALLFALSLRSQVTLAQAPAFHINLATPEVPIEHLVKHSAALLTTISLTRANGFVMAPAPLQIVERARGSWGAQVYGMVIVGPVVRTPDFWVGQRAMDLYQASQQFYIEWTRLRRGARNNFVPTFMHLNHAYYNAMSSTYFYVEMLRRSYLIGGCNPMPPAEKALLIRRLVTMERLAYEIRELMYLIRRVQPFGLPVPRVCVETPYRAFRIDVAAAAAQPFMAFPFYAENRTHVPGGIEYGAPAAPAARYDMAAWTQRWDQMDQGYGVMPPQGQVPPQGQIPPQGQVRPQGQPYYPQGQPQVQPRPGPQPQGQVPNLPEQGPQTTPSNDFDYNG